MIIIMMLMTIITSLTNNRYRSHESYSPFPVIVIVVLEPRSLRGAPRGRCGGGSGMRKRAAAPPVSQLEREANESLVTCRIALPTARVLFCFCFILF